MPLTELSLSDIRVIFPQSLVEQLMSISLCGNYGDPMMNNDLLSICRYFRQSNPNIKLTMHTNGSGRDDQWWRELAQLITQCVFSIDGLQDTNHIYRRNTVWEKIMRSVQSFIGGGGVASWHFLIFEHNQHQIPEAAELAKALGFRYFYPKMTSRFYRGGTLLNSTPIRNNDGALIGELRPPTDSSLVNIEVLALKQRCNTRLDYEGYLRETSIACKAVSQRSLFVSAHGLVFPCCWTSHIYSVPGTNFPIEQIRSLILGYGGFERINALNRPIKDILEDRLFCDGYPSRWEVNTANRLVVCARQCGAHKVAQAQRADSII